MKKLVLALVIILFFSGIAFAESYNCQYDNSSMYFTGSTKTEWGKLAKEYRCPSGHSFWVVEQSSSGSSSSSSYSSGPQCQYDNSSLYFTGNTKTEWGKLAKEYRCPSGHIYWLTD